VVPSPADHALVEVYDEPLVAVRQVLDGADEARLAIPLIS
jgi:hypothetical protein